MDLDFGGSCGSLRRCGARGYPPRLASPPPKTYAAWPVWRDGTTSHVKFEAIGKREATRRFDELRRFDAPARLARRRDRPQRPRGLSLAGVRLSSITAGPLDPSHAEIARCCADIEGAGRAGVLAMTEETTAAAGRDRPSA